MDFNYQLGEWQDRTPGEIAGGQENPPDKNTESEGAAPGKHLDDSPFHAPRTPDQRAEEFLSDWLRRIRRSS